MAELTSSVEAGPSNGQSMQRPTSGAQRADLRSSQREVRSCAFCYRRKVKCDKVYPCSRCVKRGLGDLCQQQLVVVNGKITGHVDQKRPKRQPTMIELIEENRELHRRITAQEKMISTLSRQQLDQCEGEDQAEEDEEGEENQEHGNANSRQIVTEDTPDFLSNISELYVSRVGGDYQPTVLFPEPSQSTLDTLHLLVPIYADFLVRYHCNVLHWIHAVFHIPAFLDKHDHWMEEIAAARFVTHSYDFLALYFAVLSCSLYFMDEDTALGLSIPIETLPILPRMYLDLSLNCLQLCHYMAQPTQLVLQTICVLPMVAHALGTSAFFTTLLDCGMSLAKSMNYHILSEPSMRSKNMGRIEFELAKRIWACLDIGHCMKPGAQHPFLLVQPAARTEVPGNMDDRDLSDDAAVTVRPLYQTTNTTHIIAMTRAASIFRGFYTDFDKLDSRPAQLRCSEIYNQRLSTFLDEFPGHIPKPDEVYSDRIDHSTQIDYRPWSRYLFSTLIPHCRIFLFRWFLKASYVEERYAIAREHCLSAAREIIATRRKRVPKEYQKNWHISSDTVMAAMVLATELINGNRSSEGKAQLRLEINEVILMLSSSNATNSINTRGVELIQKVLDDEAALSALAEMEDFWAAFNGEQTVNSVGLVM